MRHLSQQTRGSRAVGLDKRGMALIQHSGAAQRSHCPRAPLCGCSERCVVGSRCLVCILIRLFSDCSVLRGFCREFPDGPEVRTLRLHCRGVPAQVGERRPRKPRALDPRPAGNSHSCRGLSFQPPETYFGPFLWVYTAFEQDILVLNLWQQSNISKCRSHYESSDG